MANTEWGEYMNTKLLKVATIHGLLTGIFLTFFFKIVQYITGYKVYELLLNVDYIPLINRFYYFELVEVFFHLVVSAILSIILSFIVLRLKITSLKLIFPFYIGTCLLIGLSLFPTTAFSTRTPPISSMPSLLYWLLGHVLYGYFLTTLFVKSKRYRKLLN